MKVTNEKRKAYLQKRRVAYQERLRNEMKKNTITRTIMNELFAQPSSNANVPSFLKKEPTVQQAVPKLKTEVISVKTENLENIT